jgi:hypothetical protein
MLDEKSPLIDCFALPRSSYISSCPIPLQAKFRMFFLASRLNIFGSVILIVLFLVRTIHILYCTHVLFQFFQHLNQCIQLNINQRAIYKRFPAAAAIFSFFIPLWQAPLNTHLSVGFAQTAINSSAILPMHTIDDGLTVCSTSRSIRCLRYLYKSIHQNVMKSYKYRID